MIYQSGWIVLQTDGYLLFRSTLDRIGLLPRLTRQMDLRIFRSPFPRRETSGTIDGIRFLFTDEKGKNDTKQSAESQGYFKSALFETSWSRMECIKTKRKRERKGSI
ncbi:hypothetical protein ANTQUA_LOCUS7259 [Anthophora quadrimaculata]